MGTRCLCGSGFAGSHLHVQEGGARDAVELVPDNRRHQPMIVKKEEIDRMSKAVAKWVRYE